MSRMILRSFGLALALTLISAPAAKATDRSGGFSGFWLQLWAKAGCIVDPNGSPCLAISLRPSVGTRPNGLGMKAHCSIDPNGTPCAAYPYPANPGSMADATRRRGD